MIYVPPDNSASANSHRPFRFDRDMKFDYHDFITESTASGCG
jgi:hypothetical protein